MDWLTPHRFEGHRLAHFACRHCGCDPGHQLHATLVAGADPRAFDPEAAEKVLGDLASWAERGNGDLRTVPRDVLDAALLHYRAAAEAVTTVTRARDEALQKFGRHEAGCRAINGIGRCGCGFDAARLSHRRAGPPEVRDA